MPSTRQRQDSQALFPEKQCCVREWLGIREAGLWSLLCFPGNQKDLNFPQEEEQGGVQRCYNDERLEKGTTVPCPTVSVSRSIPLGCRPNGTGSRASLERSRRLACAQGVSSCNTEGSQQDSGAPSRDQAAEGECRKGCGRALIKHLL